METKTTLATIKAFARRELKNNNLYYKVKSSFDGMTDCVQAVEDDWSKIESLDFSQKNTLGVRGVWFVGSSRDSFSPYSDDKFIGYEVYNSCGCFLLGFKRI